MSPTLVNLVEDRGFIGTRPFGKTQSKAMRAYARNGQYHTTVEIRFLTWYQSHALNLVMSIESSNIEQRIMSLEEVTKVSNKRCTLFEGSRERSRASIKERLFESSISLKGGL